MISINAATTKTDFEITARLAHEIWTHHYTPIIGEAQVAYMLDKFQSATVIEDQVKNGYFYYLLFYGEIPVGYFSFNLTDEFLFLSKIYVQSSQRGKGIGKTAISFLQESAEAANRNKIRLTVNKYNSNSIKAYEKMGFVNIDSVVQDIGNGYVMDDYVLEKTINPK